MPRGGKRPGAGRPKGTVKEPTSVFYARCTEKEKAELKAFLEKIRAK